MDGAVVGRAALWNVDDLHHSLVVANLRTHLEVKRVFGGSVARVYDSIFSGFYFAVFWTGGNSVYSIFY